MTQDRDHDEVVRVPVVAEEARVGTRVVESGRITVRSAVAANEATVSDTLTRYGATVDRVAIGREIESVPGIREEGDLLYIPVVEEELVISRRLVLKEEIVVRRSVEERRVEVPVTVRRTEVAIDRDGTPL